MRFLKKMVDIGEISNETAEEANKMWLLLSPIILAPSVGVNANGKVLFNWDQGKHHLELEVSPAEFFYRNRETGELWSEYFNGQLTEELSQKLNFFRMP